MSLQSVRKFLLPAGANAVSCPEYQPKWPERLRELLEEFDGSTSQTGNDTVRGEVWLVLRGTLLMYLRRLGPQHALHDRETMEDLASDKALELLMRAERNEWKVDSRSPAELTSYLRRVAQNALIDRLRRGEPDLSGSLEETSMQREEIDTTNSIVVGQQSVEAGVAGRDFAAALRDCVSALQLRARRIWFLRVFHDLPSREIARHPEVDAEPAYVDVLQQRTRQAVRNCMKQKGLHIEEAPVGTFVEMWLLIEQWGRSPGSATLGDRAEEVSDG